MYPADKTLLTQQWYAYVLPVVASVGSILVGSLVTLFINSRTGPLNAWLMSLDRSPTSHQPLATPVNISAPAPASRSSAGETVAEHTRVTPSSGDGGRRIVTPATADMQSSAETNGGEKNKGAGQNMTVGGMRLPESIYDQEVDGQDGGHAIGTGDRVLLAMVFALSLLFAYLSALVGSSDLLGCFLGGLAFSGVPGVRTVWRRQVIYCTLIFLGCREN